MGETSQCVSINLSMSYFNLVNFGLICTLDYAAFLYVLMRDSAITEYKTL